MVPTENHQAPAVRPLADDPVLLLELALAGGGSLDVDRTCQDFLRVLVERGQADVVTIWRREELPSPRRDARADRPGAGWCTHVLPENAAPKADSPDRWRLLPGWTSGLLVVPGSEASFCAPHREAQSGESSVLVLALDDVGVLEVQRRRDGNGAQADLESLRPVARQLAASIRSGLAWAALTRIETRRSEDESAEREQLLGEVTSELRHALRNALTAVLGFAELLEEHELPERQQKELLGLLRREALHLNELLSAHRPAQG